MAIMTEGKGETWKSQQKLKGAELLQNFLVVWCFLVLFDVVSWSRESACALLRRGGSYNCAGA